MGPDIFFFFHTHLLSSLWTSRGHRCRPFPPPRPRFLPSIFIAHRVQHTHCSSTFHRVLLTHALALSASQFVHKKKSPQICTSMHSWGFELTKLTLPGSRITSYATGTTVILGSSSQESCRGKHGVPFYLECFVCYVRSCCTVRASPSRRTSDTFPTPLQPGLVYYWWPIVLSVTFFGRALFRGRPNKVAARLRSFLRVFFLFALSLVEG